MAVVTCNRTGRHGGRAAAATATTVHARNCALTHIPSSSCTPTPILGRFGTVPNPCAVASSRVRSGARHRNGHNVPVPARIRATRVRPRLAPRTRQPRATAAGQRRAQARQARMTLWPRWCLARARPQRHASCGWVAKRHVVVWTCADGSLWRMAARGDAIPRRPRGQAFRRLHHITARGNNRRSIFEDAYDQGAVLRHPGPRDQRARRRVPRRRADGQPLPPPARGCHRRDLGPDVVRRLPLRDRVQPPPRARQPPPRTAIPQLRGARQPRSAAVSVYIALQPRPRRLVRASGRLGVRLLRGARPDRGAARTPVDGLHGHASSAERRRRSSSRARSPSTRRAAVAPGSRRCCPISSGSRAPTSATRTRCSGYGPDEIAPLLRRQRADAAAVPCRLRVSRRQLRPCRRPAGRYRPLAGRSACSRRPRRPRRRSGRWRRLRAPAVAAALVLVDLEGRLRGVRAERLGGALRVGAARERLAARCDRLAVGSRPAASAHRRLASS